MTTTELTTVSTTKLTTTELTFAYTTQFTTTESTTVSTSQLDTFELTSIGLSTVYSTQFTSTELTAVSTSQLTTIELTTVFTTQLTSLILSPLAFNNSDTFHNNSVILNLFSSLFVTNSANFTQVLSILSDEKGDSNGCLQNCSSFGICVLNNGIIGCQCFEYFTGSSCQYDTRPCVSNPCLNNGTCINNANETTSLFECECKNTFYGLNCENQIDICQNDTCNQHGYCYTEQNFPKCKCFTSYSGDVCEIESSYVKVVKSVQLTSTIISVIVLGLAVFSVISNDTFNYFTRSLNKNSSKTSVKKKAKKDKKIKGFAMGFTKRYF
jgi:hypothetical protein